MDKPETQSAVGSTRLLSGVPFGQIKLHERFLRQGKVWTRTHGIFALPESQLGQGQSGWPISVREIVTPLNEKLSDSRPKQPMM